MGNEDGLFFGHVHLAQGELMGFRVCALAQRHELSRSNRKRNGCRVPGNPDHWRARLRKHNSGEGNDDKESPLFAGATPSFAGLYQINFRVPTPPAGLQPCDALGTAIPYANVVQSNLTVSAGSVFSFDGAGICVQPEN